MEIIISKFYAKKRTLWLCLFSLCFSACGGSFESSSEVERGIIKSEVSFQADWTSPTTGEKFTKNRNVRVNLQYYSAETVQIFNNKECIGAPLNTFPYQSEAAYVLSVGDGIKEVSAKFKTTGGETSDCFADSIFLFTQPLDVAPLDVAGSVPKGTHSYIPTSLARMGTTTNSPFPVFAFFSYETDCSESYPQNIALPMFFNIPPSQSPYKVFVEYKDIMGEIINCAPLNQIIVDDQAPSIPKIFPLPLIEDRGSFIKNPIVTILNMAELEPASLAQAGFKELNYRIKRSRDNAIVMPWQLITETAGTLDFQTLIDELKATPQLYTVEVSALDELGNRSEVLKIPWSVSETNFFIPSKRVSVPGIGEGPAVEETFKFDSITAGPLSLRVTSEARVCNKAMGACSNVSEFSQSVSVNPGNVIVFRMDRPAAGNIKTAYIDFHGRSFPWSVATDKDLCPPGFVISPPANTSNGLYLSEFCIASREMRWDDGTSADADALNDPTIQTKLVTAAELSSAKTPIHNISYENMAHLCRTSFPQTLNGRLPSTIEWNHIANDLRQNSVNWKGPTDAELPVGNITSAPPLGMQDPDFPCADYSAGPQCSDTLWRVNNRRLILSNSQNIYDFSGNLTEATQEVFDIPSTLVDELVISDLETLAPPPWSKVFPHLKAHPHVCTTPISGCGLGRIDMPASDPAVSSLIILRGGSNNSATPDKAGVYNLESAASGKASHIGFRCVTDVYR